jgi:hypothetical protein
MEYTTKPSTSTHANTIKTRDPGAIPDDDAVMGASVGALLGLPIGACVGTLVGVAVGALLAQSLAWLLSEG